MPFKNQEWNEQNGRVRPVGTSNEALIINGLERLVIAVERIADALESIEQTGLDISEVKTPVEVKDAGT